MTAHRQQPEEPAMSEGYRITESQKTPPAPGETVTLWGKLKHGPVLRALLLELKEDDCIGNLEEHAVVEVLETMDVERLGYEYRGLRLRFRRSTANRGYGRTWIPQARNLSRRVGSVRMLRESQAP